MNHPNWFFLFFPLFTACQGGGQSGTGATPPVGSAAAAPVTDHHSEAIAAVFDAHGGYERWADMQSLSYEMANGERHLVALQHRETLIEGGDYQMGFDGRQLWVAPDTAAVNRPWFYYNLMFYFYAMPFVVGDPGVRYEAVPPIDLLDQTYEGVKVSYDAGVGTSPDDNYIVYFHPDTRRMAWLMYTVTFGKEGPSDDYSLIHYQDWQEINGLLLPTTLQWYQYEDGQVGAPRGEPRTFTNVRISETPPPAGAFAKPEGATVAPSPG